MAHIHGDRKEGVGMFVKDHEWYFRHLTEHVHMKPSDLIIVEDVAQWCGENGLTEKDPHRMLRLVPGNGSVPRMLITSMIPDEIVDERIRALRIRSQLKNVGYDRADRLNSDMRKIAYLFLEEYASAVPDLAGDDMAKDEWVFEQMEQLGMFKP
jgi:hypothetical protein